MARKSSGQVRKDAGASAPKGFSAASLFQDLFVDGTKKKIDAAKLAIITGWQQQASGLEVAVGSYDDLNSIAYAGITQGALVEETAFREELMELQAGLESLEGEEKIAQSARIEALTSHLEKASKLVPPEELQKMEAAKRKGEKYLPTRIAYFGNPTLDDDQGIILQIAIRKAGYRLGEEAKNGKPAMASAFEKAGYTKSVATSTTPVAPAVYIPKPKARAKSRKPKV